MLPLTATLAEPQHFSLTEKLFLILLVFASVTAFWLRFRIVLVKILQSKKDASFHLFPIGRRFWDFLWEVAFQAKVIRQRRCPAWPTPWSSGVSAHLSWSR